MGPEIDRLAGVADSMVSADLGYRECTTVFVVIIVIISNEHIYSHFKNIIFSLLWTNIHL